MKGGWGGDITEFELSSESSESLGLKGHLPKKPQQQMSQSII